MYFHIDPVILSGQIYSYQETSGLYRWMIAYIFFTTVLGLAFLVFPIDHGAFERNNRILRRIF